MKDLKIRVDNDAESREVQELFFELDYKWFSGGNQAQHLKQSCSSSFGYLVAWSSGCFTDVIQCECGNKDAKEITLQQLRDMVVLKRNSIDDATHVKGRLSYIELGDGWHFYSNSGEWCKSQADENEILKLKPIEKPMKEYLRKNSNDTYSYIGMVRPEHVSDFMIEIPSGMNIYWKEDGDYWFTTQVMGYRGAKIIWQRHTHPEELPFIDDEPKYTDAEVKYMDENGQGRLQSLNDQYAEIEKVRQSAWQKQEGGSHYKNLKIQPMQYALENKLDYAQANVVKYVTRHKEKNGKEDLLKAIHNIELMIEFYYGGEK